MGKRIDLVDIAKGISIILVAFSHTELKNLLPDVNHSTMLVRMPLFFFLSGVFFSMSSKPATFILHKTDALLKPYYVTLFLLLLTTILFGSSQMVWHEIKGIVYGSGETIRWRPLWFLTHLWSLFVVTYLVFFYTKLPTKSNFIKISFVILLFVVGSFSVDMFYHKPISIFGNTIELPGLPFSMDIILLSMAFFVSGSFLSQKVKKFKPKSGILLITIFIFIAIYNNTEASINFFERNYPEPIFATLAAFLGIYIVLALSYYMSKSKFITTILTTFGAASLFILIFHSFISIKTYIIFSNLSDSILLSAILSFLASIIIPLFIKQLIQKSEFLMLFYFPFKSNNLFQRLRNKYGSTKL